MQHEASSMSDVFDGAGASESARSGLENAVALYRSLAEIPTISSAHWVSQHGNRHAIALNLASRDHLNQSKLALRTQVTFRTTESGGVEDIYVAPPVSTPNNDDTAKAYIHSRAGTRYVILRELSNSRKKGGKARVVELWDGNCCIDRYDVTEKHGAFALDDTFGSFSLNEDSTALLYTAEASSAAEKSEGSEQSVDDLSSFEYVAPLGEKFGGRLRPAVFFLHFTVPSHKSTGPVQLSPPPQDRFQDLLLGQATWAPDGLSIFATGYSSTQDGKRLGLVYCTNRPAAIFHITTLPDKPCIATKQGRNVSVAATATTWSCPSDSFVQLSEQSRSSRSPRVTYLDEAKQLAALVWLSNEAEGAHNDCAELVALLLKTSSDGTLAIESPARPRVLCPIVHTPRTPTSFPGLFIDQLPQRPWLRTADGMKLACSTIWGSRKAGILVSLELSEDSSDLRTADSEDLITAIRSPSDKGPFDSLSVLATNPSAEPPRLLAVSSSPSVPQQLLLGTYEKSGAFSWQTLWRSDTGYGKGLLQLTSRIVSIERPHTSLMEAVVLWPSKESVQSSESTPCIVFPHGGPHGTSTTEWNPATAALCLQGYIIVQPNYTGSLGRGQGFAHALIGQAGSLDVDDVMAAVDQLIKERHVDASRVLVQGGSHGGFLAAHLVGQFPDRFKAASMRNPVIDVGEMVATTDIRDWCYAEFGYPYPFQSPPPQLYPSIYEDLHNRSPLAYSHNITAPVLLLVGLSDKRVPPTQSRLLYHALRSRGHGPEVRMLDFEQADHALDTVTAEVNGFKATVAWFEKALRAV